MAQILFGRNLLTLSLQVLLLNLAVVECSARRQYLPVQRCKSYYPLFHHPS